MAEKGRFIGRKFGRRAAVRGGLVGLGLLGGAGFMALKDPIEFLFAQETFEGSKAFRTNLYYSQEQVQQNTLVGFGDSNMDGFSGTSATSKSFADYLTQQMNAQQLNGTHCNWQLFNYSEDGASTSQMVTSQLYPNYSTGITTRDCDVVINVGGDDFLNMIDTKRRERRLMELKKTPFGIETWNFTQEVMDEVKSFGVTFRNALDVIFDLYGQDGVNKMRHLIIVSAPDFGALDSITADMPNGQSPVFKPGDLDRQYLHRLAIELNNHMFGQVDAFMADHPDLPVLGINTFHFDKNMFLGDEHYNDAGKKAIAQAILSRSFAKMQE